MSIVQKIYRQVHYTFNDVLFSLGAERFLRKNRSGNRIIAYHGTDLKDWNGYRIERVNESHYRALALLLRTATLSNFSPEYLHLFFS